MSFPSPKDLLDPGIESESLAPPALAGGVFTTTATWEAHNKFVVCEEMIKAIEKTNAK